ncbi:MAG: hypothetical protein ACI9B9_001280 [Halioglobus sp.]|jgi:hypothetical protein
MKWGQVGGAQLESGGVYKYSFADSIKTSFLT